MTSLGSTAQSSLWSKSVEHLRDFKTIRNAGISFMCTDREVFQTYSKCSHWYYVDLQRLPDDVSDGLIYDWFAQRDTPSVYITPAHVIGGLRSRNRRVYFNQISPPPSVMLDKRTPLRQIQFTGQGFVLVHRRLSAYNHTIPPFIAALHAKKNPVPATSTPPTVSPVVADDVPPAFDNKSESSDSDGMADESGSKGEPHLGTRVQAYRILWTELSRQLRLAPNLFGLPEKRPNFRWTLLIMMLSPRTVLRERNALFLVLL
ncbi:unnamed protein product [Peronospora destructor]|uniref:Uncharacterized protein n=1 Tax=Peronospora destructor TaxID=86335 RepID=A0AAV0UPK5_9STRA|nr:unnamed protein product [Peronospora destructor]